MKRIFFGLLVVVFLFAACSPKEMGSSDPVTPDPPEQVITEPEVKPGPEKAIVFKDQVLEQIIRQELQIPEGEIMATDLAELDRLNINNEETPVYELDGLEYAVNLSSFSYRYGTLKSLDPIAGCENLNHLMFNYSTLEEVPIEFSTPLLDRVNFTDTNVSDYGFLKNCTAVTDLHISQSGLESIEFVRGMDRLESFDLSRNKVVDLSPLENKMMLKTIVLQTNDVMDISVFATCKSLEYVNISYNHIDNIEVLIALPNLEQAVVYEEIMNKIIPKDQFTTLINKGVAVSYHQ